MRPPMRHARSNRMVARQCGGAIYSVREYPWEWHLSRGVIIVEPRAPDAREEVAVAHRLMRGGGGRAADTLGAATAVATAHSARIGPLAAAVGGDLLAGVRPATAASCVPGVSTRRGRTATPLIVASRGERAIVLARVGARHL